MRNAVERALLRYLHGVSLLGQFRENLSQSLVKRMKTRCIQMQLVPAVVRALLDDRLFLVGEQGDRL